MTAELANGRTEQAHKLRVELETAAERWFRPRSIWAAQVTGAAMLLAEGDPGADAAASRAAERGQALGLPAAPFAAGAHLLVQHLLAGHRRRARSARRPRVDPRAEHRGLVRRGRLRRGLRRPRRPGARAPRGVRAPRRQPGDVVLPRRGGAGRGRRLPPRGRRGRRHVREVLPPTRTPPCWSGSAAPSSVPRRSGRGSRPGSSTTATPPRDWTAALALAERAGWTPWAAAARQCLAALTDPQAPLPLGLRAGPS